MPTGSSIAYVAGNGHLPIPTTSDLLYRRSHQPQQAKPQGLDWSALAPTCGSCTNRSSEVGADGLCPACRAPAPAAVAPPVKPKPAPKKKPKAPRPHPAVKQANRFTGPRPGTDTDAIQASYAAGNTISAVARLTGHCRNTVRRVLLEADVELRDDRATNGGLNKIDRAPEFLAEVRRLYVDQHYSLAEIGRQVHISQRTAKTLLEQQGIVLRPSAATPKKEGPAPQTTLRERIADLGVTSSDIKAWAVREGHLLSSQPGIPPARVVDAYAAAHSEQKEQISA